MSLVTVNFMQAVEETPVPNTHQLDLRHFIYSRNNTMDVSQYLAYLDLIRPTAMKSKRSALLELGFLPVVMEPSFFNGKMHEVIMPKLINVLPYYPRQPITFLEHSYTSDFPDVWVSKMDAAEFLHVKPHEVTVKKLLEAIL